MTELTDHPIRRLCRNGRFKGGGEERKRFDWQKEKSVNLLDDGWDKGIPEPLMKCDRCGSAMIQEKFYGRQEHFFGWKCIYCGEIIDHLILENRQSPSGRGKERGKVEKLNT